MLDMETMPEIGSNKAMKRNFSLLFLPVRFLICRLFARLIYISFAVWIGGLGFEPQKTFFLNPKWGRQPRNTSKPPISKPPIRGNLNALVI